MGGLTNVIKSPSSGSWVGAFQFPLNESADFTIKAIYSGQDIFTQTNYNEQSNTLRYHIKFKSDFTLNITDVEVDYGTKANITVEASEDGHFNITFSDGYNGYCLEYGEKEATKTKNKNKIR